MRRLLITGLGLSLLVALSAGVASADCPDKKLACIKIVNGKIYNNGVAVTKGRLANEGMCWKNWKCQDCSGDTFAMYAAKCNAQFSGCEGNCAACQLYQDRDAICGPCVDKNGTTLLSSPP